MNTVNTGNGLIILAASLLCFSCSSVGVFTPTAQSDVTKFGAWANKYVGGILKEAPLVLEAASLVPGVDPLLIKGAEDAVSAASKALGAYNAAVAVATPGTTTTSVADQATKVLDTISKLNDTVGAVKQVVNDANTATVTKSK